MLRVGDVETQGPQVFFIYGDEEAGPDWDVSGGVAVVVSGGSFFFLGRKNSTPKGSSTFWIVMQEEH